MTIKISWRADGAIRTALSVWTQQVQFKLKHILLLNKSFLQLQSATFLWVKSVSLLRLIIIWNML